MVSNKMTLEEFNNTYGIGTYFFEEILKELNIVPFLSEKCFIAGGFILDALQCEIPKDCDVFFADTDTFLEFSREYMKANPFKNKLNIPVDRVYKKQRAPFDCQTIDDRLAYADFTVTQFVYDGKYLYFGDNSVDDYIHRRLKFNNYTVTHKVSERITRYIEKGYC